MCETLMTASPIRAVIFDLGGTLEDVYYDDSLRLQATYGFRDLLAKHDLHPGLAIPDLCAVIKSGMTKYKKWCEESERELPPERVWNEFVFTNHDLPKEKLAAIGEELAFYWDTRFSKRGLRPEVSTLLDALRERGFRLGVISNINSRTMVPQNLTEYGIRHYFEIVLTSAEFGWRKPNPRIFLEATRLMKLQPTECAYVGDTVSRDVVGARRAGYGLAIQIKSFLTAQSDCETDVEPPDAVIQNLMQVVDVVTRSSEYRQ
jgi:putative hydrolase of the HAD superfamily